MNQYFIFRLACPAILCLLPSVGFSAEIAPAALPQTSLSAKNPESGSKQIEKDLQRLTWKQFKSVIEAIPKLKADVEAYGPAGWQYVQMKYATHGWKKNIDKLDANEKRQLVALIQAVRKNR